MLLRTNTQNNHILVMSKLSDEDYVYGGNKIEQFDVGDLVHWSKWGLVEGQVSSTHRMGVLLEIIIENTVRHGDPCPVAYAKILPMDSDEGNVVKKLLTTVYLVSKGDKNINV